MRTWAQDENTAEKLLQKSFDDAGFIDSRSESANSQTLVWVPNFFDDKKLQDNKTFIVYVASPEGNAVKGDNGKVARPVMFSFYFYSSLDFDNAEYVKLLNNIESSLITNGFATKEFDRGLDADSKLNCTAYTATIEVTDNGTAG